MKYIRTKNGKILEKIKCSTITIDDEMFVEEEGKNEFGQDWIFHNKILKQADTIEELCDEFVEVSSFLPFISEVRFEHWDKQTKKILIKQNTKVYGAIWTDKGLIYVAKMNEKGELELL